MRYKNKDIAKALGISTSSVSLALNNKKGVSETTKKKVYEFIDGLYKDNFEATFIKTEHKGNIILAVHKTHGKIIVDTPFFLTLTEMIHQQAIANSYNLIISHYNKNLNVEEYISTLKNESTAGIILIATEITEDELQLYKSIKKPLVLLDRRFETEKVNSVTINNRDAVFTAVMHAYDMGHRYFGYLRSSTFIKNFSDRFEGYLAAQRKLGIEYDPQCVFDVDCTINGSYLDMVKILETKPLIKSTVFIADFDYIAIGAMRAFNEFNYTIPNDISLIGFDDIYLCEVSQPPLTTLKVHNRDIGEVAFDRLMQIMNGKDSYFLNIEVGTDLIIRDSVRKMNN